MAAAPSDAKSIFLAAAEMAPAERRAFLDRACGVNAALRDRVEALLQAHDEPGSLIDSAAGPLPRTLDEPITERPGTVIGPYKLLEQIGEGGFGVVFMAGQTEPIRRKVALKVLKPGMDTKQVVARFEVERQALAIMDHPNIAKVHDGGATISGRPYFVMELVQGVPITRYCDEHHLTLRQRLDLFLRACEAVQHAHQKGVIHRDLKPSNILVGDRDDAAVLKVIDFGVAKAMGQQLTDKTLLTGGSQVIGTPLYMSPEQAGGSGHDVDTRSDIYSLGALVYELLTGTTPIDKERLQQAGYDEIRRIICEEEPPKPSTRLQQIGMAAGPLGADKQARQVRSELDWIVMKCLEKDRNRRYETANAFAADVQRYLDDEPVLACPPSAWYRFGKFARRYKGPLLAAALVLLTLVGGIIGTTWGIIWAEIARGDAVAAQEAESKRAEGERYAKQEALEREAETAAVLDFVEKKVFAAARPKNQGYDVKLADAVKAALPFVESNFTGQPVIEARLRRTIGLSFLDLGDAKSAIEQLERARKLFTQHRGPDHHDTLVSMTNLANAYADAGRTQEALKLQEETLQLKKAKLGPDHAHTLTAMMNLAVFYAAVGRPHEALKLSEETLQLKKAKLGPVHRETLQSMHNLANCYSAVGRVQEALKLREETLQHMKATLGPDDPDTLGSMNNLALSYSTTGRTEEGLKLYEETVRLKKAKLGPDHPDTLISMMGLSNSYAVAGRAQEALVLREETLQLQKAKLGPGHPETLRSMNNLAISYIAVGDAAKAVELLQATLTLRERRVQAEPSNTIEQSFLAWTHGQIGEIEQARLDYTAAAKAYAESVNMFEKLDQSGARIDLFFRGRMNAFRQRLAQCQRAERATKDLDFALQQPAADVPGLLDARVRFLLKEQKLAAAVETAAKFKELAGNDKNGIYNAACAYALCAGAAKNPSLPSPLPNGARGDKLAEEAMGLLKQAVAKGYKDVANMKQDKDLNALRDREDFKKLLAELETEKKESSVRNQESDKKH
jgi:serine/threonine protein kinase/tetratricopeptide (TPR) repeat protein